MTDPTSERTQVALEAMDKVAAQMEALIAEIRQTRQRLAADLGENDDRRG